MLMETNVTMKFVGWGRMDTITRLVEGCGTILTIKEFVLLVVLSVKTDFAVGMRVKLRFIWFIAFLFGVLC